MGDIKSMVHLIKKLFRYTLINFIYLEELDPEEAVVKCLFLNTEPWWAWYSNGQQRLSDKNNDLTGKDHHDVPSTEL